MALHGSFPLFNSYFSTSDNGYRLISSFGGTDSDAAGFANVEWDEFTYIPRLNAAALGSVFSDPWNSHNPSYPGWGAFGLLPPLLAGGFLHVFEHPFLSLGMWGLVNFALLALVFVKLFSQAPLMFSKPAAILMTFALMSFTWMGAWRLDWFSIDLLTNVFVRGNFVSAETDIEAGLLTHLFYALFLMVFWRFMARSNLQNAVIVGAAAGLLTYVYFFHFIFAFSMIAGYIALAACTRNKREILIGLASLGAGLFFAIPYFVSSLDFVLETSGLLYQERLSYSPGRNPIADYYWLLNLALPGLLGAIYFWLRPAAAVKTTIMRSLVVITLAYFLVLHVRSVLGYMQAPDHFWRHSLGMPATLWCIVAVADLVRSRLTIWKAAPQLVLVAALVLPVLILARTGIKAGHHLLPGEEGPELSAKQLAMLDSLDCMAQVLQPGEGFLSDEPAMNYHVMANLKGKPFMPMGLSPVGVNQLATRHLLTSYLLGHDDVAFPDSPAGAGYNHATDVQLYLYVNLFRDPEANLDARNKVKSLYRAWDPLKESWGQWQEALGTVSAAYVPSERMALATERLRGLFEVQASEACESGRALRLAPINGDSGRAT